MSPRGSWTWAVYVACLSSLVGAIGASTTEKARTWRAVRLTAETAQMRSRGDVVGPEVRREIDESLRQAAVCSWIAMGLGAAGVGLWILWARRTAEARARSWVMRRLFEAPIVLLVVLGLMFFLMV